MGKEINIDLDEVVFKVKVAGKEYQLHEPDMSLIEKYATIDSAPDSEKVTKVREMLADLGLPMDVSAKMPPRNVNKICKALIGDDTKK